MTNEPDLRKKYGLGAVGHKGNLRKLMNIEEILREGMVNYELDVPATVVDTGTEHKKIGDNIVVTKVEPGSWAESAGIREGAQIERVNGVSTADMTGQEFDEHLANSLAGQD